MIKLYLLTNTVTGLRYGGVTGLETSASKGSYFHRHIKDRFGVAW